jgi:hypothetical protein
MIMQPNQKQLNLVYTNPVVAHDLLTINGKASGEIDLIFSQVTKEDDKNIEAHVVAGLRFPSVDALKTTQTLINEAIDQIQNQEK